ncbi:MAG: hypothetical protein R3C54_08540 [Parvularculaceae bacterium]
MLAHPLIADVDLRLDGAERDIDSADPSAATAESPWKECASAISPAFTVMNAMRGPAIKRPRAGKRLFRRR